MSLEKQAIALSKAGKYCMPAKDISIDEIYDSGFIVVKDKIFWNKASEGLAKECRENFETHWLNKFFPHMETNAKRGEYEFAVHYIPEQELPDCARYFVSQGFYVNGIIKTVFRWKDAQYGKALELREIADKVKSEKRCIIC